MGTTIWREDRRLKDNSIVSLYMEEHDEYVTTIDKCYPVLTTWEYREKFKGQPSACRYSSKKSAWLGYCKEHPNPYHRMTLNKEAREAEEQEKFRQWQESMREQDDKG